MNIKNEFKSITIAILSLAIVACSDNGSSQGEANIAPSAADLDSEVYSQKSWDILSPDVQEADVNNGSSEMLTEIIGIDEYSCTNESHSLTRNPKEFMTIQPDSSVVWLGNLIQGKSHLAVGSLQELSVRERAPMGISIDLLLGDNYRQIENPSLTSVNAAIGELIENAVNNGHQASSDVFYEYSEAHSSSQASLNLGFSAEYLGYQAQTSLSVSNEANEHSYYAYFIQKAFTVSMELPTAPHDIVTDAFTNDQLQTLIDNGDIGEDNPPLYISNIGYGRILIYKMTSSHEKERIQAAISASYNGLVGSVGGYSQTDIQSTLDNSKIEIAAFGGNASNIEALIRTGKLSDYFTGDTELSSMRPISFEVRRLMDNQRAGIVRTTEYDVKSCQYVGKTIEPVGEVMKVFFDSVKVGDGCDYRGRGDVFGSFSVAYINNNTNGEETRKLINIDKEANQRVDRGDNVYLGSRVWNTNNVFNIYYGQAFKIRGGLYDKDGGLKAGDEIVGLWKGTDITNLEPGKYSANSTDNCEGRQATLSYRLERQGYLYQ